ncbi:SUMF1/EgtB/PvdO family nonheme iron enzyme [Heyndrickxia coagulans]|uniref:SUMF1/EgtB/PvdO family nonheme iron enzyme n=1 Tax=Heyndrickxia coagulans TaxID=1398 RepID=UPI00145952D8|nr:SUMF1/EgtB/PvdO family nonheme iron enzyme [Heyndrickxia coagulans]NMH83255.1 formylglycine-generating enzyme family protein [Heyndrickxia coagulans]
MAFILSTKDVYRQAVESATGGKNTVMYDDKGNPSIMVRIPRFNLSDVIDGAPNTPHPAFIVDGVTKSEIWISKYQNIVQDGRAYSLPGMDPKVYITFDQAKAVCAAKGNGWHLITNAEWAAIALWCKKNGTMPRGNNQTGQDIDAPYEKGSRVGDGRTATGSGPASWYHDGTNAGIADLNGNVFEWCDGLRLINGKIYVHHDNNFKTPVDDLTQWVDTGVFLDNSNPGDDQKLDHWISDSGLHLSDQRTHPLYTGGDVDSYYANTGRPFESLPSKQGFTVPELLKYLAIAPADSGYRGDYIWARNYGNRFARRGGDWGSGANAGVFGLELDAPRSDSWGSAGFRSALVI